METHTFACKHSFFYCLKLWDKSTRAHFHLHILLLLGQNKVTLVGRRFSHVSDQGKWDEQLPFGRCPVLGIWACPAHWCLQFSRSAWSQRSRESEEEEEEEEESPIHKWIHDTSSPEEKPLEWFLRLKRSPAATSRTSEWGLAAAVGPNVTHCAALHFKDAGRIMNKKPPHCPFFSSGSM